MGCGKSLGAKQIAGELGLPLLTVCYDAVIRPDVRETVANIKKVIEMARRNICVLFFDEFDIIAGRYNESAEVKTVVDYLCRQLDGFTGCSLILMATSRPEELMPEVWHRVDLAVPFIPLTGNFVFALEQGMRGFKLDDTVLDSTVIRALSSDCDQMSLGDMASVCRRIKAACVLDGRKSYTSSDVVEALEVQKRAMKFRVPEGSAVKKPETGSRAGLRS